MENCVSKGDIEKIKKVYQAFVAKEKKKSLLMWFMVVRINGVMAS